MLSLSATGMSFANRGSLDDCNYCSAQKSCTGHDGDGCSAGLIINDYYWQDVQMSSYVTHVSGHAVRMTKTHVL